MKKLKEPNTFSLDFLKIGMFLLGISALILATIALHAYLRGLSRDTTENLFFAYCQQGTIVIHANADLENLYVYDVNQTPLCHFARIPKNSEDICDVSSINSTTYLISVDSFKRVVTCAELTQKPLLR